MSESAIQALIGLRDFTTLQWYVVPLLALLFYVYVVEIREARRTGNWDAVIAGVTLFSADFSCANTPVAPTLSMLKWRSFGAW